MALQGTLETFELPDVLRLLSSTKKTGLLELDGDRGIGRVWLADGAIVSGASDRESGAVDSVLFDLLRTTQGSFVFEPGDVPDDAGERTDVDTAIEAAQLLLEDWRTIASVVPSLDVRVRFVDELATDSVEVDADQWRVLALIGDGTTGQRLDSRLELGELECCRRLAGMVEAGLVEIEEIDELEEIDQFERFDESVTMDQRPWDLSSHGSDRVAYMDEEPVFVDHDLSSEEVASLGTNLAAFVSQPTVETDIAETSDDLDADHREAELPVPEGFASEDDEDTAEDGGSADEFGVELIGDLPVPDADALGDDELNRNLLLKFLSSTKN